MASFIDKLPLDKLPLDKASMAELAPKVGQGLGALGALFVLSVSQSPHQSFSMKSRFLTMISMPYGLDTPLPCILWPNIRVHLWQRSPVSTPSIMPTLATST